MESKGSAVMIQSEIYTTSILAGNSRLSIAEDSSFTIEGQFQAFKAGLAFARLTQEQHGMLPSISVAFDHKGVFRKQFLGPNLTNSQKRNPRLSQLHPDIVAPFAAVSDEFGIDLSDVHVIHEDSAKEHLSHLRKAGSYDPYWVRQAFTEGEAGDESSATCGISGHDGPKANCAGITTEYFQKAANATGQIAAAMRLLDVFIETDPWSDVYVYMRGIALTQLLHPALAVRLNSVDKLGTISPGEIVYSS
jgi:hypothetical protein